MPRKGGVPENLIPATKGEVRNPTGRPIGAKGRSTILKKWIEITVKIKGKSNPSEQEVSGTVEDQINLALIYKALDGDVQAIKEINDTLYGKLIDKGEFKVNTDMQIIFQDISGKVIENG